LEAAFFAGLKARASTEDLSRMFLQQALSRFSRQHHDQCSVTWGRIRVRHRILV